MTPLRKRLTLVVCVAALMAAPAIAGAVTGYQGPLFGITTAPNGDLLVADASVGIESIRRGETGPTIPMADGGVTDVSALGRNSLWVSTGAGEDPEGNSGQGLWRISNGEANKIADLFVYESEFDPDGGIHLGMEGNIDSNPFDVQSLGGEAALVADAGGNDLLRVSKSGQIELLAVFPDEFVSTANAKDVAGCPQAPPEGAFVCGLPDSIPAQAVPTSIAIGPDGSYYVGELKGFPGPLEESRIWKVSPHANGDLCPNPDCQVVFDGGFTSIIDLAFGPDARLYVAEIDEESWLRTEPFLPFFAPSGGTIDSCDIATLSCNEVAEEIPVLTSITFDKHGSLWATRNALIPGAAEVFEVD